MDKQQYLELKKQLSFERPFLPSLVLLVADAGLLAFALYLLTLDSLVYFILSQMLLALFFFHNFGILHEAVHGNLSKKKWVNSAVGHYASIFCFTPYFPWRQMHQKHHYYAGSLNKDPTMRLLEKMKIAKKIPFLYKTAWHVWLPLPAAAQHILFWFYPLRAYKEGVKEKHFLLKSVFSSAFILSAYVLLAWSFPEWFTLKNFGLAIFFYFILTEVINLPHHMNVPVFYSDEKRERLLPWEQHVTTRSCHYPGFLSECVALNFNLHIEHHYFPNLPWYKLKAVRAILKPALGSEYTEVSDWGWNIKSRVKPAEDIILKDVPHPLLNS